MENKWNFIFLNAIVASTYGIIRFETVIYEIIASKVININILLFFDAFVSISKLENYYCFDFP